VELESYDTQSSLKREGGKFIFTKRIIYIVEGGLVIELVWYDSGGGKIDEPNRSLHDHSCYRCTIEQSTE